MSYSDVDWGMVDDYYDKEEDTVLDIFKKGDRVQLSDGAIGIINNNKTYNNMYTIIGPYRQWSRSNVKADDIMLLQEHDPSRIKVGDPILKAHKCRIPTVPSKRLLGYVVEDRTVPASNLIHNTISVMFDDCEEHIVNTCDVIKVHEIKINNSLDDLKFLSKIDMLIDGIGTKFLNGEVIQVESVPDKNKIYYAVVHNNNFKTFTEVYIENGFD